MTDISRAKNIQAKIRGILGSPARTFVSVPEIQRERPEDAIHKLQIQIFELADSLAQVTGEVERLRSARP